MSNRRKRKQDRKRLRRLSREQEHLRREALIEAVIHPEGFGSPRYMSLRDKQDRLGDQIIRLEDHGGPSVSEWDDFEEDDSKERQRERQQARAKKSEMIDEAWA